MWPQAPQNGHSDKVGCSVPTGGVACEVPWRPMTILAAPQRRDVLRAAETGRLRIAVRPEQRVDDTGAAKSLEQCDLRC
jgi:hypothetical protein